MPRIGPAFVAPLLPLLVLCEAGCSSVPYTNRQQLMFVSSESEDLQRGAAIYQQVINRSTVVDDPQITEVVQRVGQRIAAVADKPEYHWEFTVLDDPTQATAFCLPGGKVAVYTGFFPIARDEGGLAAVIGHEVAHTLARHSAVRTAQKAGLQGAAYLVSTVRAPGEAPAPPGALQATQSAIQQAYSLGTFSDSQESEADHIGLILMAKAGYDPEASLSMWERLQTAARGQSPPQWLSTHPSPETRRNDLFRWLPEAERYYKPSGQSVATLPEVPGSVGSDSSAIGGQPQLQ